jgi:protein-tyrosine phosphatase
MDQPAAQHPALHILFVCMGNICRSPAAEIIFKNLVHRDHLDDKLVSDSAGTISYHEGSPPDRRMLRALANHGYSLPSLRARQIQEKDLEQYDLILTMDSENYSEVSALDKLKRFRDKIKPMCKYITSLKVLEVPDPYYGRAKDFDHVVDLLEEACSNLLKSLEQKLVLPGHA